MNDALAKKKFLIGGVVRYYRAKTASVVVPTNGVILYDELTANWNEITQSEYYNSAGTSGGNAPVPLPSYAALQTLSVSVPTMTTVAIDENLSDTNTSYIKYPDGSFRAIGGEKQTS